MRKAAFQRVLELSRVNSAISLVVSDVGEETIRDFRFDCPDRIVVEGIAEGHLIGMASGMAKEGGIVFVNTIASFLTRRCLEQIAINLCLEGANVKLLAQGGGLVYGQHGPTHHAIEDIALMRALPGMTVLVPCDVEQTRRAIDLAVEIPGPVYIRLAKGNAGVISKDREFRLDRPTVFKEGRDVVFVALGTMAQTALAAAEAVPGAGVIGVHAMKPFPTRAIAEAVGGARLVVAIEEHSEIGGLGSCMCETLVKSGLGHVPYLGFALKDAFVEDYGKQESLLEAHGLTAERIRREVMQRLSFGATTYVAPGVV